MIGKILLSIFMIGWVLLKQGEEVRAASGWIIFWDGSYHGKVIDIETKEPIEGAVVAAAYSVSCFRFIQKNTKDVGVQEVLTQADGTFRIPLFWTVTTPECLPSYTWFLVFKPDYGSFPRTSGLPPSRVYSPENRDLTKTQDLFRAGVVLELPKLKTKEELRKDRPFFPVDTVRFKKELKNFFRLKNERAKIRSRAPSSQENK